MNSVWINGIEKQMTLGQYSKLQDLLTNLRGKLNPEKDLISSVVVNGVELSLDDEEVLSHTFLEDIEKIEIRTIHPRELAEDILQNLRVFTEYVSNISTALGESLSDLTRIEREGEGASSSSINVLKSSIFGRNFLKLIESVETFVEAFRGARETLKIGDLPSVRFLEAELTSTLKDMLQCQESGVHQHMKSLLQVDLPENMKEWKERGLPDMIESRDS